MDDLPADSLGFIAVNFQIDDMTNKAWKFKQWLLRQLSFSLYSSDMRFDFHKIKLINSTVWWKRFIILRSPRMQLKIPHTKQGIKPNCCDCFTIHKNCSNKPNSAQNLVSKNINTLWIMHYKERRTKRTYVGTAII